MTLRCRKLSGHTAAPAALAQRRTAHLVRLWPYGLDLDVGLRASALATRQRSDAPGSRPSRTAQRERRQLRTRQTSGWPGVMRTAGAEDEQRGEPHGW